MKFAHIVFVVLAVMFTFLFGWADYTHSKKCRDKGGTVVKTNGDYVCAKVEVIKP